MMSVEMAVQVFELLINGDCPVVAPSVPTITGWETGDDFVNVSWTPTSEDSSDNPGHKFEIEYRKHGQ